MARPRSSPVSHGPLFPTPELTDPQQAVLTYLADRQRAVTVIKVAGELGIGRESAELILARLSRYGLVEPRRTRGGRRGRISHTVTPSGRTHARALAVAAAWIAPLSEHGLTRRQAQVLYSLLVADAPLTPLQLTANYLPCGLDTVRTAARDLKSLGLCTAVDVLNVHDLVTVGYLPTDAARALTDADASGNHS